MRSAEYALVVVVGIVLVYLFVVPQVKHTANSLNNSANLIVEASNGKLH